MSEAGRKFRPYYVAGKFARLLTYGAVAVVAFALGGVFNWADFDWHWKSSAKPQPDIIIENAEVPQRSDKEIFDRIVGDQEFESDDGNVPLGPVIAPNKVDALKLPKAMSDRLSVAKSETAGDVTTSPPNGEAQSSPKAIQPTNEGIGAIAELAAQADQLNGNSDYPIPQIALKEKRVDGNWGYPQVPASDLPYQNDLDLENLLAQLAEPIAPADKVRFRMSMMLWKCGVLPEATGHSVTVQFKLKRDGSLDGEPTANGGNAETTERSAALDKIKKCAPYRYLPVGHYDHWKQMEWTFMPLSVK